MTTVPRFRYPIGYDPCNPTISKEEKILVNFFRPWTRFENSCITSSFSKSELQMRLKAETLQYRSKQQTSRAEKYARVARKNLAKKHYNPKVHIDENGQLVPGKDTNIVFDSNGSAISIEYLNENCKNPTVHKSLFTCGSNRNPPCPSVDLYLDPSVPLINFGNQRRTYLAGSS
jgi:hypothetical protein